MNASSTAALLRTLWQRNLPLLHERLDLLDRAAAAAQAAALPEDLRQEALSTAHKLAGALGMFGYPEGTAMARQLEAALENPENPALHIELTTLTTRLRATLNL